MAKRKKRTISRNRETFDGAQQLKRVIDGMTKNGIMKRKMTLETLAQMVARGFADTATKAETATKADIERLDKRIDGIEIKIDNLDMKVSAYVSNWDENFTGLRNWVGELDQRIRKVERAHQK